MNHHDPFDASAAAQLLNITAFMVCFYEHLTALIAQAGREVSP